MQNPGAILAFTYRGSGNTTEVTTKPTDTTSSAQTVSDDGAASPPVFTADQAAQGKIVYGSNCATCHGQNLISATYGTPLAGPYFDKKWRGQTVGALYSFTHDKMPPSRPGALPENDYVNLIAYILSVNGGAAGDIPLTADPAAMNAMTIPPLAR